MRVTKKCFELLTLMGVSLFMVKPNANGNINKDTLQGSSLVNELRSLNLITEKNSEVSKPCIDKGEGKKNA